MTPPFYLDTITNVWQGVRRHAGGTVAGGNVAPAATGGAESTARGPDEAA